MGNAPVLRGVTVLGESLWRKVGKWSLVLPLLMPEKRDSCVYVTIHRAVCEIVFGLSLSRLNTHLEAED